MTAHELSVRSVGEVCVITLGQDVDTAVACRIEAEIVGLTAASVPLVVDLSGVEFLDSAGVRLMDRLVGRHRRAGSTAVMVAPASSAPWFTLRMCEFPDEYLATSVCAGVEAAAAAVSPGDQHS